MMAETTRKWPRSIKFLGLNLPISRHGMTRTEWGPPIGIEAAQGWTGMARMAAILILQPRSANILPGAYDEPTAFALPCFKADHHFRAISKFPK